VDTVKSLKIGLKFRLESDNTIPEGKMDDEEKCKRDERESVKYML